MKNTFTTAALLFSMTTFAQVGINNTSPKATLDITAKATDGTKPEGLIIPQLSGNNIHTATAAGVYGANQKGLIVYASSADTNPTGATANITAAGYYYFDGGTWQRILETSSGDTTNDGWVNDTANSMIKLGTKANGTARTTGTDVVVKDDGKVGIGESAPKSFLHINTSTPGGTIDAATFSIYNCGTPCGNPTARNIVLHNYSPYINPYFASIDFVAVTDPLGLSGAAIRGIDRDVTNNYAGLSFFTRNATDYDSRMVIKSSGNVGIGTNAPITKLDTRQNPGNASPGSGAIAIGETTQTASAAGPGAVRYSTSSGGAIEYSNGTSWNTLTSTVKKSLVYGYLTDGQSLTYLGGTFAVTEEFDQNNDFASNKFIAPRTGNYSISVCGLAVYSAWTQGEEFSIAVNKNGVGQVTAYWGAPTTSSYYGGSCASVTISAVAGDQITFAYFIGASGKTIHTPSFNRFSIQEL